MLTVEDYGQIRRAHRDGMSIRAMARVFHRSRCKIREALARPQPQGYTRSKDPPAPKLDPFKAIIDGILKADEQAPPKQRHTAMQLFRRLQGEQKYAGGYAQVRRYVQKHRRDRRETFIPLAHDAGQRLECDFGHIAVDFPDGRRPVAVFVAAWSYSNCPFTVAMAQHPVERVQRALHAADRSPEALHADRIIQHTFRLSQRETGNVDPLGGVDHDDPILAVQVGMPDLSRFDQLLSQGERAYV